jgi:voltage-gated potassium channel
MTAITITTVGYREIHPMSRAGEVFTTTVLLVGVGTFFYTFTLLATVVVDGGIHARLARRRRLHMLDDLKDHFIVCGYGRIGAIIVEELRRQRVPYVVIERDRDRVQAVMELGGLAVEADASSEEVLTRLGIARARGFIAAVGTDAENVYTVLSARLLRPDLFIIARAEADDVTTKLKRAGADRVLAPYQIGGVQMALTAMRPAVVDFVSLATDSSQLDLMMEQVRVEAGAPLAGQSIVSADMRRRFGVVVVGIQRAGGRMEFNPAPDAAMSPGDHLVVLGPPDRVKELEAAAQAGRADA